MTETKLGPYKTQKAEGTYQIDLDLPAVPFREIGKRGVRDTTAMKRPVERPYSPATY